ncbi:MAG: heterodisulfide reductase subunit A [Syntrophobacter sp. DG_60]|nr:MAG: heterodisulfide reductase subunit A [Syntrophobacter sp. DG_60]
MVEKAVTETVLVVGGGMSGVTAAVEVAEVGYDVLLIEKRPYLGGRVAQLYQYFPKLCPPLCGMEINYKRIRNNPRIRVFTLAEVQSISGQEGDFDVVIKINPRYVNENCTCCGECAKVCSLEIPSEFDYGMSKTKAAYLPYEMAFPMRYVLAPEIIGTEDAKKCLEACKYNAIDLEMKPKDFTVKVGSIIWATGWKPYDAAKIDNLGFGQYKNIITNVMMERLAAPGGPTKGKIVRPSDGGTIESVAFVQCAGSRDENHLPFCSNICCLASMKQAHYVREQYPNAKIYIFYIDVRPFGRFEDFYTRIQGENVNFIKGKVAKVEEDPKTKKVTVEAEDILSVTKMRKTVDLVVLATGMAPTTIDEKLPFEAMYDDLGFLVSDLQKPGIYPAGCVRRPMDVMTSVKDATAAALKAIQSIVRR